MEARRASEDCGSQLLENTFLACASGFDASQNGERSLDMAATPPKVAIEEAKRKFQNVYVPAALE
jgi:hypothetical protein